MRGVVTLVRLTGPSFPATSLPKGPCTDKVCTLARQASYRTTLGIEYILSLAPKLRVI